MRRVVAHPAVKADVNRVAITRGPIVYCAESIGNPEPLNHLLLDEHAELEAEYQANTLGGGHSDSVQGVGCFPRRPPSSTCRANADTLFCQHESRPGLPSCLAASIADAAKMIAEAVGDAGLAGLVNNAGVVFPGPVELIPMIRKMTEESARIALSVATFANIMVPGWRHFSLLHPTPGGLCDGGQTIFVASRFLHKYNRHKRERPGFRNRHPSLMASAFLSR